MFFNLRKASALRFDLSCDNPKGGNPTPGFDPSRAMQLIHETIRYGYSRRRSNAVSKKLGSLFQTPQCCNYYNF